METEASLEGVPSPADRREGCGAPPAIAAEDSLAGSLLRLLASRGTPFVAALLAIALQLPGLFSDFTYDDRLIIQGNSRYASWQALPSVFTTDYFGSDPGIATAYRPLTLLSFGLGARLHGDRPAAFRAVNLLLHGLVVLLVAAVALRLFRRGNGAALAGAAAILFAVHPVHVEAVTSLVGRAEALSTTALLGGLLLLLPQLEGRLRFPSLLLAGALYAAAIFCKENAVVLPGLLLLCAHFGAAEAESISRRIRRWLLLSAFLAVPLAGTFVARKAVLGGWLKGASASVWRLDNPLVDFGPLDRFAHALRILVFDSLRAATIGWPLRSDSSWATIDLSPPTGSFAWGAGAFVLVLLLVLALRSAGRRAPFGFGVLFFLAALLPTSNLLFTTGTIFAERTLYLPSAGVAIAVAALFVALLDGRWPEKGRLAAAILFAAAVGLLAGGTILRTAVWKSDLTLYTDQVEKSPRSARAQYNLGTVVLGQGKHEEARKLFLRATELLPEYYIAWDGAARAAWNAGDLAGADELFETALRWHCRYERSWEGLVDVLLARKDPEGAFDAARRGVANLPGSVSLRRRLVPLVREWGTTGEGLAEALALALLPGATTGDRLEVLRSLEVADEPLDCRLRSARWARFVFGLDPANRSAFDAWMLVEDRPEERAAAAARHLAASGNRDEKLSSKEEILRLLTLPEGALPPRTGCGAPAGAMSSRSNSL